jgi:hypothetical protein
MNVEETGISTLERSTCGDNATHTHITPTQGYVFCPTQVEAEL